MTVLILGGSSGLGRALTTRLASAGHDILIVARDARDLERVASDVSLTSGRRVNFVACDLATGVTACGAIDAALATMAPLSGIMCAAGGVSDDDAVDRPDLIAALTAANFAGPSAVIAHYLGQLPEKRGFVVGVGSVAATRGRTRNPAYAAAKSALRTYFASLRHAYGRKLIIQFYILGFLDTALAFGRPLRLPAASPTACANYIARKLAARAEGEFYFPWFWRYVSFAVSALPWGIFRRLDF